MTLTALELKLWHKRWFPDFDGGHFENGPKQVVHPNFFLMASTFDIRGGPMNNKNLVSDCPGGVHGNPIWPMDYSQCVIMWSPTANELNLSEMGQFRDAGPALKRQHWNNSIKTTLDQCHLSDPDIVCVIGQGRLTCQMVCLRCRSAALRTFSTTIVAMASDAIKTKG